MGSNKLADFFGEPSLNAGSRAYDRHQLGGAPSCFAKKKGKLFLLAREPLEDTIDHACMDTLHIAERVKGKIINEQFHLVLVLYMQILKAKKTQNKLNRGIDEKVEKAISAAIELYSLIEKQSENKNKKYLKEICSICDTLSHLLMRYNEDVVAERWGEELPTPRGGDLGGASGEDTLAEDEEPHEEKAPLTEKEPQGEETSGPQDSTQHTGGEKNVKGEKEECPHLGELPHGETYLENDFSTRNCIRCLYAAKELSETEYYDPHRKTKPFRYFQSGDPNLTLQDRKKLRKRFNRICRSKSYLLKQRRSSASSLDGSLSKGGMNLPRDLRRILLGTNKTITTFGTDKSGNINATIEFFTPYGGKEKNVINLNEYDYFFCSSGDESEVQSNTDGQPQNGRTPKGNSLFNRNNIFYVGNKKVLLNRKKKEKIIFQMNANGMLTKEIFKKGKQNENVLIKSFNENEWSDEHVDFCYLNEQKKKEKIVITKGRDGMCKRLFLDHELNGKQESFDLYRRGVFSVREVHLYDDAEAMAFRLLRRREAKDQNNRERAKDQKNRERAKDRNNRERANLGKEKKKFKGAEGAKTYPSKRTLAHTNEWSLEKGTGSPGSSKETSLESIFSKLKRRKERYLKAIYLCSDKETGPIRKSQNLRRIKMNLNGWERRKHPVGKRLTGKVPPAEGDKAVQPTPPQMDSPRWETQIGKVKKPKRPRRGGADAPLRKSPGSAEKKGEMDRKEKGKEREKGKEKEKGKESEKSKMAENTKRGEKSHTDKHHLRDRFTEKNPPQDDSPKEGNHIKLGEKKIKLGGNAMTYSKRENGYMNIYTDVKESNGAVAVGTFSLAKLASVIEKSHEEGDNPETDGNQKTNKKIEEFVFNENLKDISITSHNVSRKSSKNCVKYHQPQGEIPQEESGHILKKLHEEREASGGGPHGVEDGQPNGYPTSKGGDVIRAISKMFSKEDANLGGETGPTKLPTYRLHNNPDGTTDKNIFKKSSISLGELSKSPSGDMPKNALGYLRDHVGRQLSDSQSDVMSHQLNRQMSSQASHQMSSQASHQMSSQMSDQLGTEAEQPLKNIPSEVSSGLKSDPEAPKEERNVANEAAVAVRTQGDFPKGVLQQVNGPLEEEKKKRQQYLSRGFRAYAHIVLSESNVVTRKCIVSFDYASKKLSIVRNRKVFNIDVDKLYVQEMPTYEDDLGVIELVISERRSRVLLLESRDLVGLQNLGDEIGWISTPNARLGLHRGGTSLDTRRTAPQNMEGGKKDLTYKLNNHISKGKISFFDKIKLKSFLGKKK
ncbi:conserved Plasmodium protein, unknown function [Plasmodium vivax]|uniref:Uncharacterized protein n=2 Tax=Plasmodium vivax TaxID=5855 RepID=A0A0J9SLQ4_PLAV1|nr:hypothetical protein PVBG_00964 [Plasmodium vivax Brazil I]CAG9476146.1 unnamed protein product [Plasmodium vivax]SCO69453.1 conserved Plasmodium protein, unknown function [Plasmodium vivax]SCO74928.1 conserved Plasmodium protein, unknown function [Plasmodium vivax]